MNRPTLQTIADRVGVSRMTVSNAFSRPDQLSAELREKILAVAEEIGYCGPDPAARTLARGRSGAVGMVVPGSLTWAFTEAISVEFLAGVAEALEPAGLALTVLATPCDQPAPPLQGALMDGAIVHSISTESPVFDGLRRRRIPLVVVDDKPDAALDCVNVDDRGGAKLAAQHLVELGHRTVGLVAVGLADGPRLVPATARADDYFLAERLAGWRSPLRKAGASVSVASHTTYGRVQGRAAASLLLDRDPRPTALLCANDLMALGAVDAVHERGLRVPDDVSVVGFDDGPFATAASPALTTVAQPVRGKGRIAGAALVSRLDGYRGPARHERLPVELVVRGSTGPARP